jgi:hypothetical protein
VRARAGSDGRTTDQSLAEADAAMMALFGAAWRFIVLNGNDVSVLAYPPRTR